MKSIYHSVVGKVIGFPYKTLIEEVDIHTRQCSIKNFQKFQVFAVFQDKIAHFYQGKYYIRNCEDYQGEPIMQGGI